MKTQLTPFECFLNGRGLWIILAIYALIAILISCTQYFSVNKDFWGGSYTHYNNFMIFKLSYTHLLENKNLYLLYLHEYADQFKYSPTFAFFMKPFNMLPTLVGLITWNLLNTVMLFHSIKSIKALNDRSKIFLLLLIIPELVVSVQNSQSNAVIAALLIMCYNYLEKSESFMAALVLMLSASIKIFGLAGLVIFIFYPSKIRSTIYIIFIFILLILLPLLVITPEQLWHQYLNWKQLLIDDQSASYGISVMGWLNSWFGIDHVKELVVIIGIAFLFLPLIRVKQFINVPFKLLFLSSILIWIVIFNHKAESPTYIIALTGITLWYFTQQSKPLDHFLFILVLAFTVLSSTDLFPQTIRNEFIKPYNIKSVPCILVWIRITWQLCFNRSFNLPTGTAANDMVLIKRFA